MVILRRSAKKARVGVTNAPGCQPTMPEASNAENAEGRSDVAQADDVDSARRRAVAAWVRGVAERATMRRDNTDSTDRDGDAGHGGRGGDEGVLLTAEERFRRERGLYG